MSPPNPELGTTLDWYMDAVAAHERCVAALLAKTISGAPSGAEVAAERRAFAEVARLRKALLHTFFRDSQPNRVGNANVPSIDPPSIH